MKPKILIVDDEELFLMSIQELLQNHFDVTTAESAAEALLIIKEKTEFAVIITDIHMPEMDGIQLLEQVNLLSPRTVRIILTSDFTQQATQNAVNTANIFAYLKKPCPIANFAKTIRNAIKQYNSIKQQNVESLQTLIEFSQIYNNRLRKYKPNIFSYCDHISIITHDFLKTIKLSKLQIKEISLVVQLLPLIFIDLSTELCEFILAGGNLDEKHNQDFFMSIQKISLETIPDNVVLQSISRSLLFIAKGLDGSNFPADVTCLSQIPISSRIIKLVMDYKKLLLQNTPPNLTKTILFDSGLYDSKYLHDFEKIIKQNKDWEELEVTSKTLAINMILKEDIHTPDGGILVARNEKISMEQLEKIKGFGANLHYPIKVYKQNNPL
ncbi:MAG: response regulator [Candidatus Cloacimonetes bacterium]|nr:response regulator [Candidatus Cloacimonadota bacterium]